MRILSISHSKQAWFKLSFLSVIFIKVTLIVCDIWFLLFDCTYVVSPCWWLYVIGTSIVHTKLRSHAIATKLTAPLTTYSFCTPYSHTSFLAPNWLWCALNIYISTKTYTSLDRQTTSQISSPDLQPLFLSYFTPLVCLLWLSCKFFFIDVIINYLCCFASCKFIIDISAILPIASLL